MIFGINTTSDISKLLYNLRQFWNITSGIYAKYHVQIMLLFVYATRYFKLSWNNTALNQSNCRNFWCCSIMAEIKTHLGHPDPKTPRIPPRLPCKGITNILITNGSSILYVIVSGEPRKNILFKCQHQVKTKECSRCHSTQLWTHTT